MSSFPLSLDTNSLKNCDASKIVVISSYDAHQTRLKFNDQRKPFITSLLCLLKLHQQLLLHIHSQFISMLHAWLAFGKQFMVATYALQLRPHVSRLKIFFRERKSFFKTGFLLFAYGDVINLEFIQHSFLFFSVEQKRQADSDEGKKVDWMEKNRNSRETIQECDEHKLALTQEMPILMPHTALWLWTFWQIDKSQSFRWVV